MCMISIHIYAYHTHIYIYVYCSIVGFLFAFIHFIFFVFIFIFLFLQLFVCWPLCSGIVFVFESPLSPFFQCFSQVTSVFVGPPRMPLLVFWVLPGWAVLPLLLGHLRFWTPLPFLWPSAMTPLPFLWRSLLTWHVLWQGA